MDTEGRWVDTATSRRATRLADHRATRRDQIVRAAAAAIEEHGPGALTSQIADRAGLPRPHVYRHFTSKDDLDDAVARFAARQLTGSIRPTFTMSGTALGVVRNPIAAAVDWAAANPNLYRFLAARRRGGSTQEGRPRGSFILEIVDAAGAYLGARGIEVRPPDGLLAGLVGLVDASILWWLDHNGEPREDLVERLTRYVWLVLSDLLHERGVDIPPDAQLSR